MVQSSTISITPATHADNHRTGGTDPLTGIVGINSLFVNAAKDILPTTDSGFSTPAANLARVTDEDNSTITTGGESSTANEVEIIKLDLGAIVSYTMVTYGIQLSDAADPTKAYFEISDDDSTWVEIGQTASVGGTLTELAGVLGVSIPFRYLRMRVVNDTHNTLARFKIRDIRVM